MLSLTRIALWNLLGKLPEDVLGGTARRTAMGTAMRHNIPVFLKKNSDFFKIFQAVLKFFKIFHSILRSS
nr:MAG TPA: hypothetical protein [Caudoviricetes sp.]